MALAVAVDETQASEHSPLLRSDQLDDVESVSNNGALKAVHDDGEEDEEESEVLVEEKSTWQLMGIMASVWIGTLLAAIDSTMVATLTAPISSSFNSLTLISWLASSYYIANATIQPLSGKLTDIYGRRAGIVLANIFFTIGNLICGLAQDQWVIIVGRVVAGIGGGAIHAVSTFVASDLIPLRQRGLWQGIGNILYGVGAACGGVYGGSMHDWLGWRWGFLIQVPLSFVCSIVVYFTINIPVKNEDGKSKLKRIDFLGAGTLVVCLVVMLLGLNSGGNLLEWTHPLVISALVASAFLLALFLYIEANVAVEPLLPIRILSHRTILAAFFTNWFLTMAVHSTLFYGPIYFQLRGATPTQSGLRIIPQSVGVMTGSITAGTLMRRLGRYYKLNVTFQAIEVVGFVVMLGYGLHSPRWPELVSFFLIGTGYGAMLTITLIALIAAVDHKWQAVATSGSYAFRSTGSVIGITISSAVFTNILRQQLQSRLAGLAGAEEIIRQVRDNFELVHSLPPQWKLPVEEAYISALKAVFGTILGLGMAGSLISLFMREHKLFSNLARRNSN